MRTGKIDKITTISYLLVENRLGLSTITRLLPIITPLPLGRKAILTLLVLGNFVQGMLLAGLVLAVSLLCFWHVNLSMK
jgi:hypothetical protein